MLDKRVVSNIHFLSPIVYSLPSFPKSSDLNFAMCPKVVHVVLM